MAKQKKQEQSENEILQHKKRAFLSAYAQCGNITKAAEAAQISRQTHYDWMRNDPEYPRLFEIADQEAGDRLEAEARRRAVEGWEEPVFHKGEVVGTVRKYSDTLLIFLLNGAKPEKYKQRTVTEHSGKVTADVHVTHDLSKLDPQELAKLEEILSKAEAQKEN